jgi:hypothetical protein
MRKRAAGRCCQGLLAQPFRAFKIGSRRGGQTIEHAAGKRARHHALRLDGVGVERQGSLQQADALYISMM